MLRDLRGQISGKCTVSSERRTRDYDWAAVAIGTTSSAETTPDLPRYLGSDTDWGFALYRASSEDYDDAPLPDGSPSGTPEQALDYALGLYLADPTAWIKPPKD